MKDFYVFFKKFYSNWGFCAVLKGENNQKMKKKFPLKVWSCCVILLFLSIFIYAQLKRPTQAQIAIQIGDIRISLQEFNQAFLSSPFARKGNKGEKEFLKTYIIKKLILKDAESKNLDKTPQLLNELQLFWERALLKLAISKKAKEISDKIKVSEAEIKEYYEKNKDSKFSQKKLSEVYSQIKSILLEKKQRKAMQEWIRNLQKNTKIKINYKLLGIEP